MNAPDSVLVKAVAQMQQQCLQAVAIADESTRRELALLNENETLQRERDRLQQGYLLFILLTAKLEAENRDLRGKVLLLTAPDARWAA